MFYLIPDKLDFKLKQIIRDKEHFILIKETLAEKTLQS